MKKIIKDVLIIATILSSPIWVIPYLLYHYRELRKELN